MYLAGGLGWGGNMRFRTGLQMIDLTMEVSRRLEDVEFPFLVMHDPGDCEFFLFFFFNGYIFFFLSLTVTVPDTGFEQHGC